MALFEALKTFAEKVTGIGRPNRGDVRSFVGPLQEITFFFEDDGLVPNHPAWPLIIYRGGVALPEGLDPAAVIEDLFLANGWSASWRNGIYDYVHYHSRIHEVLGVARGSADVEFGGRRGRTLMLNAGDVAVLPAGTGHRRVEASGDFLVVGAYPAVGTYDECTTVEDHDRAIATVPAVPRPDRDPVYGAGDGLVRLWNG